MLFFLYKQLVLIMFEIVWAHFNNYTGSVFTASWMGTLFSNIWTTFPILWLLLFDSDLPKGVTSQDVPELYTMGPDHYYYNRWMAAWWLFLSIVHG